MSRPTYRLAELALLLTPPDPNAERNRLTLAKAIGVICTRQHCTSPTVAHGLCDKHYRKARNDGHLYVIGEVRHLLGTDSAHSIAARLGYSHPRHLARMLGKWGEHELAARIDRETRAEAA